MRKVCALLIAPGLHLLGGINMPQKAMHAIGEKSLGEVVRGGQSAFLHVSDNMSAILPFCHFAFRNKSNAQ